LDFMLCKAIEPKECLGMAWTKEDKETRSPNLLTMIRRFNHVSRWIAAELVAENNVRKRGKVLSHILHTLKYLQELNNFSAIFQIVAGLGNSSVHRLAKTFALLDSKDKKMLEEMRFFTNPNKSWANYRNALHGANPPCVPFIGVFQTDLTFIEDGNPAKFSSGLVNFKKCRLVASVIAEIQQYQLKPYNLTEVPSIMEYLTNSISTAQKLDDKRLWEMSLESEPRTAA